MGKYTKYHIKAHDKRGLKPIWRGIGCILLIIAPLLAYGMMLAFSPSIIATGKVPYQLLGHAQFPEWFFRVRIGADFASYLSSIDNLWINIITFFVMLLTLIGAFSLLYTLIHALVGPARYTDLDAPPSKYKGKKYTR